MLGISGNPALVGVASCCAMGALIAMQCFAGALVDRVGASVALRGSSLAQALGWAAVLCAAAMHSVWAMILFGTIAGAASGLDGPAEFALTKSVVKQEDIGRASAVAQGREAAAGLVGTPLGGAIYSVGHFIPLVVQIVLGVGAALLTPRVPRAREQDVAEEPFLVQVRSGFKAVFADPGLRGIALVSGLANFPLSMLPITLFLHFESQGTSGFWLGVLMAIFGAGMIAGSFLAGPLSSRVPLGRLGIFALGGYAVGCAALVFAHHSFLLSCIIVFVSALPLPAFNSAIISYTMSVASEDMVGRIGAASGVPGMILMPLGVLFAGVAFAHAGARISLVVAAVAIWVAVAAMAANKNLRSIPKLEALSD